MDNTAMDNTIIEVVWFKANSKVTEAQLATAAQGLAPVLAARDGFIGRELAHDGEQWVDIVHWRDLAAAQAASEAVVAIPACQRFFAMIDHDSLRMLHCQRKIRQDA